MDIDIQTLVLFYFVANVLNSGLLFLVWRLYRKQYRGLFFLLVNLLFQMIGSFFLLLGWEISSELSIIVSSLVSASGMIFALKGMERFFIQEKRRIYNYIFLAAFLIITAYFTFINDSMVARNVCASVMTILIAWQACVLLLRIIPAGFRRIARFTAFTLLAYGILSIGRIAALVLVPQNSNEFFSSGIVNSVSMILYCSLNILYTVGLIMMVNRRLLNDVQSEKDKYNKAFNSAPYLLILTRVADGKIFEVNEGFINMTGYQPEEVLGKTTLNIGLWAEPADRASFVSDFTTEDDVHEKEVKFRIKSGAILTGLVSAKRISAYGEDCILTSFSDITEMNKAKERLEEMALHDTLTGLPNRKLFYDRVNIAFSNARREKGKIAVVSLDLDGMKYVNDHLGHAAGDQVLVTISKRLYNLLRKGDTISRFGGDEFLILLNAVKRVEDVDIILNKICGSIAEPFEIENQRMIVTASLGVAIYPDDDLEIDALIRKSDEAMYHVKTHGRNGFMYFKDIE